MKHLLTPLLGALTLSLSGCQDKPQPQFIRVENGRFVGGSANSGYFVGANFWYGALLATEGPGRDRDRLCRELDRLKASGIGNLRVLVGSEGNTGVISKVEPILQTAPGVYDDRALDGLDFLMSELGKRDMQAVLYLTNAWEWSGGYSQYLEWSGRGTYPVPGLAGWDTFMAYVRQFHEAEATDSCKILLEKHIRHIVTRTNRYTGRPYREDPAIFSWQIANEPRAFSDDNKERFFAWVARTAKLIKQLDPNHMVSTGSEGEMGCEGDIGLWRRIHALPEPGREVVYLRTFGGLSFREIGEVLGRTERKNDRIHPPPCGNRTGAGQTARHRGVRLPARQLRLRARLAYDGPRRLLPPYLRAGHTQCSGRRHRGRMQFLGLGRRGTPRTPQLASRRRLLRRPGTGRAGA